VSTEPDLRLVQPTAGEIVASGFRAFARHDKRALLALLDPELEFRPVNALGLTEGTGRGHEAVLLWMAGIDRAGTEPLASPRTIEMVGADVVLAAGVLSERGLGGGRFAASVAWLFRVRDGLIVSAFGYSSEAAARRALHDWA
jgi:ketosteroid isomerase-like protein